MDEDRLYYQSRAETQVGLARATSDPRVAKAHYTLAGHYLDRVYGPGARSPMDLPLPAVPRIVVPVSLVPPARDARHPIIARVRGPIDGRKTMIGAFLALALGSRASRAAG